MKIVIPELMDADGVRLLQQEFDTTFDPTLVKDPARFRALLPDVTALIVRKDTQVVPALLDLAPHLKVVARLGVGLDNIDVPACRARGIEVIPATGANTQSVAEHVIMAMMLLCRPSFFESAATARGEWPRLPHFADREIAGQRLGLVGFGAIGRRVAQLARALDVEVIACDPAVPAADPVWAQLEVCACSFDDVLAESDIVSVHVPLSLATRDLIGAPQIARMRRGSMLINSSRGGIINEPALVEALRSGHLGAAHLDVFASEPVARGSIFANVPNLLLTPHLAGITRDAEARIGHLIATRVTASLRALSCAP